MGEEIENNREFYNNFDNITLFPTIAIIYIYIAATGSPWSK